MRIAVAALLAAIVIFIWQAIAHMLLPIGMMGFRLPQNEDVVLQAVSTGLPAPGIYYLPSIDPARMNDEAVMKAWAEKSQKNPFVFAVVNAPTADATSMTPQLVKQFITQFIAALLASFVLAATAWTFGARVIGGFAFGVFGWLTNIVPLWTWYRFPSDFIVGNFLEQAIGWILGGIAIAWWLGRGRQASGFRR
jgi:hypothetical protein